MLISGNDEVALRRQARAALNAATIPRESPTGLWGGNGSGESCPVCGQRIDASEMELEVEFAVASTPGVREFHLHLPCFTAWELERKITPG
jgi:hypothetical protein